MSTSIEGKSLFVTGASRGIGAAIVDEALRRGAARIHAAARTPAGHSDPRVIPVAMDISDESQVNDAVAAVDTLDILVNNAGVQPLDDLSDPAVLEQALAVNLFGTYRVTRGFLPALLSSRGTIVNNLSLAAMAPVPFAPAYAASKAAALSLTQSLRMFLRPRGVTVNLALTGPTDTVMTEGLEIPKTPPSVVAAAILDGVENGVDDIFPDPYSQTLEQGWRDSVVKQFEAQNAALVAGA